MDRWLKIAFGLFFIPGFLLAEQSHSNSEHKDKGYIVSSRNRVKSELEDSSMDVGFRENGKVDDQISHQSDLNRNVVREKRRTKKYRHIVQLPRPSQKRPKDSTGRRKKSSHHSTGNTGNTNVKTYRTYEEIHEHVDEPAEQSSSSSSSSSSADGQYEASDRYETREEPFAEAEDSKDNGEHKHHEKQKKHETVKVKHHHHHHHHNHVKIKKVPQPYPVEKIVDRVVEKIVHVPKIVEKIVHVPKIVEKVVHVPKMVEKVVHVPVDRVVEKVVHVPVEKIIEKIIHIPKPYPVPVSVPRPYPVITKVPYPVEIKVPVPIEKPVPYTVEKKVPVPFRVPYRVEVEKKVPVYIQSHEPYRFEPYGSQEHMQRGAVRFDHEFEEPYEKEHDHDLNVLPANYNVRKLRQPKFIHPTQEPEIEKGQRPLYHHHHEHELNSKFIHPTQEPDFEKVQRPLYQHHEHEPNRSSVPLEPTSAGSEIVPLKSPSSNSQFKIHVADVVPNDSATAAATIFNDTVTDLQPQASSNSFQGMPMPMPMQFHFIHLQPMPFQSPLMPVSATGNGNK